MQSRAESDPLRATLSRLGFGLALLVTALLVAWHVVHALQAGALWRDEAHVVNWASLSSLAEVWSNRHLDAFPATWPLLLHGWISLAGGSDASLRGLGALIGIASLAAIWWTARQLGVRAPLFALVLFAANPCVLVFGDSLRGYGLAVVALIFFLGTVACLVARPRWKTVALAQLAALLVANTYFGNCVFVLAALVAGAAVAASRRRWKLAALVLALGAIPATSLLPYLPTYRRIVEFTVLWQRDYGYVHLYRKLASALGAGSAPVTPLWWLVTLLALAACTREILTSRDPEGLAARDRAVFVLVTLAVGVPGFFLYLESLQYVTQIWYYQPVMAVLALCADGALALRKQRSSQEDLVLLVLATCAIALGAPAAWRNRDFRLTNLDQIAARLGLETAPDDLILVNPYYLSTTFERYYRGAAAWMTLPEVRDRHFQDFTAMKQKMTLEDPIRSELDRIVSTLRAGHRVWCVGDLKLPNPGSMLPHLPPAPAAETGWYDTPYLTAWSAQVGDALLREARTIRPVLPPLEEAISPFENERLTVAERAPRP